MSRTVTSRNRPDVQLIENINSQLGISFALNGIFGASDELLGENHQRALQTPGEIQGRRELGQCSARSIFPASHPDSENRQLQPACGLATHR